LRRDLFGSQSGFEKALYEFREEIKERTERWMRDVYEVAHH
jgi:hypothetical protein